MFHVKPKYTRQKFKKIIRTFDFSLTYFYNIQIKDNNHLSIEEVSEYFIRKIININISGVAVNYKKFQQPLIKRLVIAFIIYLSSFSSLYSQNEQQVSVGTNLDYGFGKDFNNFAASLNINYTILQKVRISPVFSLFLKKDNRKMRTFDMNFNYLLPNLAEKIMPILRENGIVFYPIAGFIISGISDYKITCYTCSENNSTFYTGFIYSFGFNFGAGIEYELPTILPLFRNMKVNFEAKYQTFDNYSRPLISFGLINDF